MGASTFCTLLGGGMHVWRATLAVSQVCRMSQGAGTHVAQATLTHKQSMRSESQPLLCICALARKPGNLYCTYPLEHHLLPGQQLTTCCPTSHLAV